jgi:DNA topoisomerase-3
LLKAGCKKSVKRLWISSLTDEAIQEGFAKLKNASEFDNLFAAGNSRAIGDWILGINGTR